VIEMQMPRGENKIQLQGRVIDRPTLSHTNHGVDYYLLPLSVPRLSGAEDELKLILSQRQLDIWTPDLDQWVRGEGEVRSFNNRSGVGNKLVITVLVRELDLAAEEEGVNQLELEGALCKPPILRRTPLGRDICDLLLAVNRAYGRADYLPCIAWGTVAVACGGLGVGDRLHLSGRLQSRRYKKVTDGREESRVAYEISVMNLLENT
jgi:primosomal replication protein N